MHDTKVHSKSATYPRNVIFVWVMIATLCAMSIMYAFLINGIIVEIVQRKNIDSEILRLSANISELEFDYIQRNSEIDLELAYALGYHDVDRARFMEPGSDAVLTLGATGD